MCVAYHHCHITFLQPVMSSPHNPPRIARRQFVKSTAAAAIASGLGRETVSAKKEEALRQPLLVQSENAKEGSLDWQLTRVRVQPVKGEKGAGYRSPWIEGYCSRQSVSAGER